MRQDKEKEITSDLMRRIEKQVMLDVLDRHWKENLVNMDHLRQGIGLRSFAAKNPKQEYKRESFDLFLQMLENIKRDVIVFLYRVSIRTEEDIELEVIKVFRRYKSSDLQDISEEEELELKQLEQILDNDDEYV